MTIPFTARALISEDWLRSIGFRWHQLERQPSKQWLLWIGDAIHEHDHSRWFSTSSEDFGLELAAGTDGKWFCWFRGDTAGRYHRFIHVRHLLYEVVALIAAIIGGPFKPENAFGGTLNCQHHADYIRGEHDRLDLRMRRQSPKWSEVEKDDSRGRALPEHLEFADWVLNPKDKR